MTEIAEIVRNEVQRQGVLPFVEFMRLALYCPKYGYYEQAEGRIGREGDFYTSVSIGSVFGELLAFQFADWLEGASPEVIYERSAEASSAPPDIRVPRGRGVRAPSPSRKVLQLAEAGAHDGRLAADILTWLREKRPALLTSLEYWIIEPSSRRQALQKMTLDDFAGRVRWFDSLTALPRTGVTGIIFSNELLDAMPVHRLGWDAVAGRWFEWGVALNGSHEFTWTRIPRQPDHFARELNEAGFDLPPAVFAVLPDAYTVEICPEAGAWWRQAALALKQGKLLTVDYGWPAEQFFAPEQTNGTLRAYHRHNANAGVLTHAGEQDLTAHVNFTQLQQAGEAVGLRTEGLFSQERFFTNLAAKSWQSESDFGHWTPARLRQFQTLTHPEHLGRPFSVLLQAR